jgi:hypothetical protein
MIPSTKLPHNTPSQIKLFIFLFGTFFYNLAIGSISELVEECLLSNFPQKTFQIEHHNVQSLRTWFPKSYLGIKFHLLKIFIRNVFAY